MLGEIGEAISEACFSLDTLVTTGSGKQKLMKDLKIGEEVLSDETGSMTKVLGWLELNYKERVSFLEIKTHDGEELIMTETHIVGGSGEVSPNPNQHLLSINLIF